MRSLFLTVFNMSLTASYVALAVIMVRMLLKKAPKIFSYALWAVVLFRLVCPFTFESSLSLIPDKTGSIPEDITFVQNTSVNNTTDITGNWVNEPLNSLPIVNSSGDMDIIAIVMESGAVVWVLGIISILLYVVISYLKLKHKLSTATLVRENIFETDRIQTPFVLGLIKPRIFIPIGISGNEIDYIIEHEKTHIKRYDYAIKPVSFLVLAVHWFNPIVWLSYFLMVKDMEMSCDESVMKHSNRDIRASYSFSLLSLSAKQSGLLSPLAFGESNVKSRIKNVLSYKKPAFWMIIVAIISVLAVVVGFTSNPKANPKTSINYENDKYGFSLVFTKDFAENVSILEEGNHINFAHKQIQGMYPDQTMGVVGRVEAYDKKEMTKDNLKELEDAYNLRYLGENDKYYFGWAHATDVQVYPDASKQLIENYRLMELEFDKIIKTFKINNAFEDSVSSSQNDDYTLIIGKRAISLGTREIDTVYEILGKPISENTEVLDNGADTFEGSRIKTLKYQGMEMKLFSPKGNDSGYWIMSMDISGSDIKTLKGISVGSTMEELKKAYSSIEVVPDGRSDKSTYTWRVSNEAEYKYMEYVIKDGIVTGIRLYVEMP